MIQGNLFDTPTYIHRFTGERLTIKRLYETVAVCRLDAPHPFGPGPNDETDIVICKIENLIKI